MASTLGTSLRTKYYYDDDGGMPVDITSYVLNNPVISKEGVTEEVTPYGIAADKFLPTGRVHTEPIELSGLFKTGEADDIDDLFADRLPEAPEAATRTFTAEYVSGRTESVETFLSKYDVLPNRENGLTKFTVVLRPDGDVSDEFLT